MFTLTIAASSPAELLVKLQETTALLQTGTAQTVVNNAVIAGKEDIAEPAPEPKGRGTGRRNTKKEETAEDAEPKGRRARTTEKKLVDDNPEQATLRAQLITDLQDLADVEEAHKEVQDALKRVGGVPVSEIASASLGDFNEDIQALISKYFD